MYCAPYSDCRRECLSWLEQQRMDNTSFIGIVRPFPCLYDVRQQARTLDILGSQEHKK